MYKITDPVPIGSPPDFSGSLSPEGCLVFSLNIASNLSTPVQALPRQKPRSLHDYIVAAANAQFPSHNGRRLARVLALLSARRTVGDGWVTRAELAALWPVHAPSKEVDDRKRWSGTITNAMSDLKAQITHRLSWTLPHFTIKLEADPPHRAVRYRLNIVRREPPWDFQRDEAPNTLPLTFTYRFKGGPKRVLHVRPWVLAGPQRALEIEAVREPPEAEWTPASLKKQYYQARDDHFSEEATRHAREHLGTLHDGTIWGIKALQITDGAKASTVRILTEKASYADLHFLKRHLDRPFPAMKKAGTYRDWLQVEAEPRSSFCPPRDALCVAVLVMVRDPEVTVFIAKQKKSGGDGPWGPSAAGAANDAYIHVDDDHPDLKNQVSGVVHREIGIKVDTDKITWLGFARGLDAASSSAVLALVESELNVRQVLHKFGKRRMKDDIETLAAVPLAKTRERLDKIPAKDRAEFLELILALAAIDQRLAEVG